MKSYKPIDLTESWSDFLTLFEEEPFILFKKTEGQFIVGWGIADQFKSTTDVLDFDALQDFIDRHQNDYVFGYLTYDVKNTIEPTLVSLKQDNVVFPLAHFFVADHVINFEEGMPIYYGNSSAEDLYQLLDREKRVGPSAKAKVTLKPKTTKEEYVQNVKAILNEIQYGNIYEMNYCVNFEAIDADVDPVGVFQKLNQLADAPFSVFMQMDEHVVLSASPERYIQRIENKLISQPIKGTARRGNTAEEDQKIKQELLVNSKERSENIMITDLVRNDLSKVATKNSVNVDELCGAYTFKTVHQLISTVSCEIREDIKFTDVIKATFPMGSMTGAPKVSAMQIAERMEDFRRGLYSGTIGYIDPSRNFDFNVVIRSILYNRKAKVVSCGVGGAITIHSNPEKEYEECLLKLNALQKALC